jgi:hypothetical protein
MIAATIAGRWRNAALVAVRCCAALTFALALLAGDGRASDEPCVAVNCGPGCVDFWVIDTHCVPCCGNFLDVIDRIAIWHCEPTGWVRYSREGFVAATDSGLPVCFYIHGIFSNEKAALDQAHDLFGNVGAGLPPFRGVLWSWPSNYECGMSIRDQVYRGIANTQSQAFYLATIIDSLGPRVAISLVGCTDSPRARSAGNRWPSRRIPSPARFKPP